MIINIKLLQFPIASPALFCTFVLWSAGNSIADCSTKGGEWEAKHNPAGQGLAARLSWEPILHSPGQAYGQAVGLVHRSGTGFRWTPCTPAEMLMHCSSGKIWVWENLHLKLAPKKVAERYPLLGLTLAFLITASFKSTSCVVWILAPNPRSWLWGNSVSCSPPHCSKSR